MEPVTAAEDLVNSMRIDYSLYRGSVYQLDRHPLFKLQLYFRQSSRIARCEYCGDYFIPKTRKQTLYCDRQFDGRTCKTLGPPGH